MKITLFSTGCVCLFVLCVLHITVGVPETAAQRSRNARGRRLRLRSRQRRPNAESQRQDQPGQGQTKSQINTLDPDKFLEKFGYLPKYEEDVQHSPESRNEAIRNFQRMTGLRVTGRLDTATRTKMVAPRCGMPDMVPEGSLPKGVQVAPSKNNRRLRPENFYVPGYKWKKNRLSWKLTNYSPDMDYGAQRRAMHNAFSYWSSVSPLEFSETSATSADIMIKFAYSEHGDGNPFDYEGGILAHAFYPENGDTHFDEGEYWTEGTNEGTNLEIVAAHEFGHALGLGHSNIPNALMAPYYQGYDPYFKLHTDDIQGIQTLYGSSRPNPRPTSRPPPRPRPTKKPSNKPNNCQTKFGAVMQDYGGRIYIFQSKWLWQLNYWGMDTGYPTLARKVFDRPPTNIGAAVYSWRTRYTYFFKGTKIFKYYGTRRIERKTVKTRGYPRSIQAAFMGRDGNIYLLQGDKYWTFDEYRMTVKSTRGRPMSEKWPGVPANIEAAVRLNDGYLYFVKGSKYRKFDETRRRVLPGYPKNKAPAWMGPGGGCTRGEYIPK